MSVFTFIFLTLLFFKTTNATSSRSLLLEETSASAVASEDFGALSVTSFLFDNESFLSLVVIALMGTASLFSCVFVFISALALIPGLKGNALDFKVLIRSR